MTETTNLHLKKPENLDFVNVADLNYNSDILDETIHQIQEDIKGDIDTSAYATAISMTLNSDTYVISAFLTNKDGETLGTPQTIDLPLETMVVGGSYDDNTKKVVLTLKNGNTVEFSVADLVSGLQSEITSSNKLNSDLISDTNQNNKFVTSAEKTAWTAKQSALTSAQLTAVNSGIDSSKVSQIEKNKDALAELIDSGQKNLASVNSGTFTAPTTPDGARYVSIPIIGVSGDVVLYIGSLESDDTTVTTCGLRLQFVDGTTQTIQINRGNNVVTNISLAKELTEIGVYPANGYTASAGKSLSFQNLMLCSKAAWDISQNYVPYRPSYDELVARITALENA